MKRALFFARAFNGFHDVDYAYDRISKEIVRRGIATVEKATETQAFIQLDGFDLLLICSDGGQLTPEEEGALVSWVEGGGSLIAIHGAAASFKENEGYHRLVGGQFIKHPPRMRFNVWRRDGSHLITRRMPESFQIEDELYLTEQKADYAPLMVAKHLGEDVPIVWVRQQGKGRVCFVGLGHGREAIDHPEFLELVCNASRWTLRQQPRPDVRVGLVGYGGAFGMGKMHGTLTTGTPGMNLVAACDLNPKQMEVAAQDWPGIRTYTDPAALAADSEVDFVVVIVPHNVHAQVAGQMLDAGKHVMVEKPFTITGEEAKGLIEKARAKDLTLTVFHNRRWDRDFMAVREVVEAGEIGVPYQFECFLAGYSHPGYWWRSDKDISGGLMHDWGAHGVDWGLNLIGDEVDYVSAWTQKRRWYDVSNADAAKMIARFKNGQLLDMEFGNLSASRKAYMRVLGSKGAIEVRPPNRDLGNNILVYRDGPLGLVEELRPYRLSRKPQEGHPWVEWSAVDELYRGLANHFLLGDPVPVTPESAARVIGVIEAAYKSAESGRPEPPTYW